MGHDRYHGQKFWQPNVVHILLTVKNNIFSPKNKVALTQERVDELFDGAADFKQLAYERKMAVEEKVNFGIFGQKSKFWLKIEILV